MNDFDLKVNQLIEIEMDQNGKKVFLASRIEAIEERYMLIATPIRRGIPLLLPSGSPIVVQFRKGNTFFSFESEIMGRYLRPIPLWMIKKPVSIYRVPQKRSSVRLPINLPVQYQYLDRDDDSLYEGVTIDISATGILFSSAQSCDWGEKLKVDLFLGKDNIISSAAKVVRTEDKGGLTRYRIAVEFEDMPEIERDRIFKFMFDKQREWIRKVILE